MVMRHPWVTKRGAWPLQTVREMGGCPEEEDEINPQLVSLPDMMSTLNVLDIPRQVSACWIFAHIQGFVLIITPPGQQHCTRLISTPFSLCTPIFEDIVLRACGETAGKEYLCFKICRK